MKTLLLILAGSVIGASLGAADPSAVSGPLRPSVTPVGSSFSPQFSADGRYIVFASHAKNLTTNTLLAFALNVYRYELASDQVV